MQQMTREDAAGSLHTSPRDEWPHRLGRLAASWRRAIRALKRPRSSEDEGSDAQCRVGEDRRQSVEQRGDAEEAVGCVSEGVLAEPEWMERLRSILCRSDALQQAHSIAEDDGGVGLDEHEMASVRRRITQPLSSRPLASMQVVHPTPPPLVQAESSAPLPASPMATTVEPAAAALLQEAMAICAAEGVEGLWSLYSELRNLRVHRRRQLAQQCMVTAERIQAREQVLSCLQSEMQQRLHLLEDNFLKACNVGGGTLVPLEDLQRRMTQLQQLRDDLKIHCPTSSMPGVSPLLTPAQDEEAGGDTPQLQPRAKGPTATVLENHLAEQRLELHSQMQELPQKLTEVQKVRQQLEERYRLATEAAAQLAEEPGNLHREIIAKLREQQQQILESTVALFGWKLLAVTPHDVTLQHLHTKETKTVNFSDATASASATAVMLAAYVVAHEPVKEQATVIHQIRAGEAKEEAAAVAEEVSRAATSPPTREESPPYDGVEEGEITELPPAEAPSAVEVAAGSATPELPNSPLATSPSMHSSVAFGDAEIGDSTSCSGGADIAEEQGGASSPQNEELHQLTAEEACEAEDPPTIGFSHLNTEDGDTTRGQDETMISEPADSSPPLEQLPPPPRGEYTGFFSENNLWDDNE